MIALLTFSVLAVSAHDAVQYSDAFARDFMLPLSAAAYSEQPQQCLSRLFPNATLQRQITVQCDDFKKDTCSAYTAVLHDQKAIVLSFRGTTRFLQLLEEVNKTVFLNLCSWLFGGKISRYFSDGFMTIWGAGMYQDLTTLRSRYADYEIWVTGHSLGGSMASLAASFLVGSHLVNASQIKLITFGQPRTGDTRFSENHNTLLEYSYRVTHWRDIVPHIPLGPIGGYYHHRREAFYRNDMTSDHYTICNEGEGKQCSDGLWFTTSILEHTHYFGKQVAKYGRNGCT